MAPAPADAPIAEVDGVMFHGRFEGFGQPLDVIGLDAEPARLMPWSYRAHMDALREALFAGDDGLTLDARFFAARVLARSGIGEERLDALAPIALWWAAGGAEGMCEPVTERVDLGAAQARLRPWSERERLAALVASGRGDTAGAWFDAPGYLDAMVRASLLDLDPAVPLDELDSQATNRLLDAIVALNVPDPATDPLMGDTPGAAAAARATLDLCRQLGWTPTQVWTAPAAEIDRLLRLLALSGATEPGPPRPATKRRRLADEPDATVFRFEDD